MDGMEYIHTIELRQFGNHMFQLQLLKLSKVDVVDSLMPHVNVRLDLLPFHEHSGAYIISFKHPNALA